MPDIKCPRCDNGRVKCPKCNGKGWYRTKSYIPGLSDVLDAIDGDDGKRDCENCDTLGTLTCSRCDGNGVVFVNK